MIIRNQVHPVQERVVQILVQWDLPGEGMHVLRIESANCQAEARHPGYAGAGSVGRILPGYFCQRGSMMNNPFGGIGM